MPPVFADVLLPDVNKLADAGAATLGVMAALFALFIVYWVIRVVQRMQRDAIEAAKGMQKDGIKSLNRITKALRVFIKEIRASEKIATQRHEELLKAIRANNPYPLDLSEESTNNHVQESTNGIHGSNGNPTVAS